MFLNTMKIQNQHLIKDMVKKWINSNDFKHVTIYGRFL